MLSSQRDKITIIEPVRVVQPGKVSPVDANNNAVEDNDLYIIDVPDDDPALVLKSENRSGAVHSTLPRQDSITSSDEEFLYVTLTCGDCLDLFPTKKDLLLHRLDIHGERRPYQCPACMASFHRAELLVVHKLTHTSDKPHACAECGQRFTRRSHVAAHGRVLHPLAAAACQRRSTSPRTATATTAATAQDAGSGGGAGEFRCQVCVSKTFKSARSLANHRRCHRVAINPPVTSLVH